MKEIVTVQEIRNLLASQYQLEIHVETIRSAIKKKLNYSYKKMYYRSYSADNTS